MPSHSFGTTYSPVYNPFSYESFQVLRTHLESNILCFDLHFANDPEKRGSSFGERIFFVLKRETHYVLLGNFMQEGVEHVKVLVTALDFFLLLAQSNDLLPFEFFLVELLSHANCLLFLNVLRYFLCW